MTEISVGLCQCGCGRRTTLARQNNKRLKNIKGCPHKFIYNHHLRGSNHPRWNGGQHKDGNGYVMILIPGHPRADVGGYVREHILVAEKALGKSLPERAVVHHANGTKDSGPLVICQDNAYHQLLHRRERALNDCGHTSWRKCRFCKQYDDPENMISNGLHVYHRACMQTYQYYYHKKSKERSSKCQ